MMLLEEICARKYSIFLCNGSNLRRTISNCSELQFKTWERFIEWEQRVHEHVIIILNNFSQLHRSKFCNKFINLIGIQMMKWTKFHKDKFGLSVCYLKSFLKLGHFLDNGVIDREIAARDLVQDVNLSISVRFKIACFYFLPDKIVQLWKKLSNYERNKYKRKDLLNNGDKYLASCADYLTILIDSVPATSEYVQTFYHNAFKVALNSDSEVAVKHCWNMIDPEKREDLSQLAIKKLVEKISDICYLLPKSMAYDPELFLYFEPCVEIFKFIYHELEPQQFKKLFNQFEIGKVLEYFLYWPRQNLFLNLVNLFWDILTYNRFYDLLLIIVYKMNNSAVWSRDYYELLLKKFWIQSPHHFKSYVCRMESKTDSYTESYHDFDYLISSLFCVEEFRDFDIKHVRMILENCNNDEKKGIANKQGKNICHWALEGRGFKLADCFIESCVPFDERRDFKRNLFTATDYNLFLNLIFEENYELAKEIYKWAFDGEDIESFKEVLLNILSFEEVVDYFYDKPSIGKNIDEFLNLIMSPHEIAQLKLNFYFEVNNFIDIFMYLLRFCEFEVIDAFVHWYFHTEIRANYFKTDLTFILIDYYFFSPRCGFDYVNEFIHWSKMNEVQRKQFKYGILNFETTLIYLKELVGDCKFKLIDEFINWSEMSDTETKLFKKFLFCDSTGGLSSRAAEYYSILIVCGKEEVVDFALRWSELSGRELKEFRRKIRIGFEKYTFDKNFDVENVEKQDEILSIIKWSRSSEEDLTVMKTKIILVLKNMLFSRPIQYLNEYLEFVDVFLKYCELNEKEIKNYKIELLLNERGVSFIQKLIKNCKWNEIYNISKWLCLTSEEVRRLKRKFFKVSSNLCFQLAIKGRYRDLIVFLKWLEIDGLEEIFELKKYDLSPINIYEFIFKITINNKRGRKHLIKSIKITNGLKGIRKAFLAFVYCCWKHKNR
ncbi:UNVERIFIED_CONTAM: hypothetical protein RMT77_014935 [Armadillidium vulgare]